MISVKWDKKNIFRLEELDRKPLIQALRKGAQLIARKSRKDLSRKHKSSPGEIPGMQTGDLRKAVKTESAKRAPGLWSAVVFNKPNTEKMFYPAPLFYGRKKGDLVKRVNPLDVEADKNEKQIQELISKALDEERI